MLIFASLPSRPRSTLVFVSSTETIRRKKINLIVRIVIKRIIYDFSRYWSNSFRGTTFFLNIHEFSGAGEYFSFVSSSDSCGGMLLTHNITNGRKRGFPNRYIIKDLPINLYSIRANAGAGVAGMLETTQRWTTNWFLKRSMKWNEAQGHTRNWKLCLRSKTVVLACNKFPSCFGIRAIERAIQTMLLFPFESLFVFDVREDSETK
jgi:hypothetical protein